MYTLISDITTYLDKQTHTNLTIVIINISHWLVVIKSLCELNGLRISRSMRLDGKGHSGVEERLQSGMVFFRTN